MRKSEPKTGIYSRKTTVVLLCAVTFGMQTAFADSRSFYSVFGGSAENRPAVVETEKRADHVLLYSRTDIIEQVTSLRIAIDVKTLSGFLVAPICHVSCVNTRLSITPETVAYEGITQVPLKEAKNRLGRSAEIIYDVKTKEVVRISW